MKHRMDFVTFWEYMLVFLQRFSEKMWMDDLLMICVCVLLLEVNSISYVFLFLSFKLFVDLN